MTETYEYQYVRDARALGVTPEFFLSVIEECERLLARVGAP